MLSFQTASRLYRRPLKRRQTAIFMLIFFLFSLLFTLTGCQEEEEELREPELETVTDYGDYGENVARDLAMRYPYRSPFSEQEVQAGNYVRSAFEELGYQVEMQTFSSPDMMSYSTNYIVRIMGNGFMQRNGGESYISTRKTVVIGSHYDAFYSELEREIIPDFSGIQDNASGIGVLLTIAKALKTEKFGYDVVLVAFGAGSQEALGSQVFYSTLTPEEKDSLDVMYNIESIYAGDKLYAHSGWNSLIPGAKYEKRRKLYELYDVVYEYELPSEKIGGFDILYNESNVLADINGDGIQDAYREVTMTRSDHTPFDEGGIPVVFIESYDYNFDTVEDMKETKNLSLQTYGGQIRDTGSDSLSLLSSALDESLLQRRINTVAFAVTKAVVKGSFDAVTAIEYAEGIRLPNLVSVPSKISETEALG